MSGFFSTPSIVTLTAKAPFDSRQWQADFSNLIPTGDTIAVIDSVIAAPSDLVVGVTEIIAGKGGAALAVGIQLSGGSVGNQYLVTTDITTVGGTKLSRSFILPEAVR